MNLYEQFKSADRLKKAGMIILFLLIIGILDFFIIYQFGSLIASIPFNNSGNSALYYVFTAFGGISYVSLFFVLAGISLLAIFRVNKKNMTKSTDKRGVHYMEQNTYGSAEWLDEVDAEEIFEICHINDMPTVVYGQLTENGEKAVGYKKPVGAELNRNTLVIASSGSGKSYCVVKPFFLQHIKAGDSICASDPGGGLYADLSEYCRKKGVETKVINLADPAYSETWDMMKECINPLSERLDPLRLNQFVEVFLTNTGEGARDFFYEASSNLIKTVIAYTGWKNEEIMIQEYEKLYHRISPKGHARLEDVVLRKLHETAVSFPEIRERIMSTALENGYFREEIEDLFTDIREYADLKEPFTFDTVYRNINSFHTVEDVLKREIVLSDESKTIPPWHTVWTFYRIFIANNTENVRSSALQGAQLKFTSFSDPSLRRIVSTEGLKLNEFNLKQTALFVITNDKSSETKPIASLLFSFLFKDVQDIYDREEQMSKGTGKDNPCLGTAVLLDDFFSLGVIGGGDGSTFSTIMSDGRKRRLYITIIIQQYDQLGALYGGSANSIQGNCATLLYIRGNDPSTIKFISEFSGEATILDESHQEINQFLSVGLLKPEYRASASQRNILTNGEARLWKKMLVIRQSEQPLELNLLPWTDLPQYRECEQVNIYQQIKPYDFIEEDIKRRQLEEEARQQHKEIYLTATSLFKKIKEKRSLLNNINDTNVIPEEVKGEQLELELQPAVLQSFDPEDDLLPPEEEAQIIKFEEIKDYEYGRNIKNVS